MEKNIVIGASLFVAGWVVRSISVMHQARYDNTYKNLLKNIIRKSDN